MDQVLEQSSVPSNRWICLKTAECYQRLASLTIRQDSKLSYLAGRIAGVRGRCIRKNCRKPSSSLQLTMPSMAGK